MLDPEFIIEDIQEILKAEEVDKEKHRLGKALARLKKVFEAGEYTLDDSYLRWLRDLCEKKNWAKARHIDQQTGQSKEVDVAVHPGQLELFTDLDDKIAEALSQSEAESEEPEKKAKPKA